MIKYILLVTVVIFFAMNMGASGVAPSFAASYGGRLIKRKAAVLTFGLFVIVGACLLGKNVALTLGKDLVPKEFINFNAVLIILSSASVSLFLANILKVPQSTSQVTVSAAVGVGLYIQHLYTKALFYKILPMWVILPLLSYVLTFLLYRLIYPPERDNLHIYQKMFANERKLKVSSLAASCYVAFAIGSNNVANAVGPLSGAGLIGIGLGLASTAPLFGLGAWLMGEGNLETAGREIVPLGNVSGTLVAFVTATLLIVASFLGIPQSLVQLNLAAIFAISSVKNGHRNTLDQHLTKKTFIVWAITPLLSVAIAYMLSAAFLRR
ncbi:MAG: inorganic phosphate transporter [Candidatus Omnitrophota bacterium]|nr:inorganic phosphate transporter [Candidatus Omnitrophota bacterium]